MSDADRLSKQLAEEKKRKEKEETMNRLTRKKLEYNHKHTYKRQNSYKGHIHFPLVPAPDLDDFKKKMYNIEEDRKEKMRKRSDSYDFYRKNKLRPI